MPPSASRLRLLVLTSTYPRWPDDPEPGFVHELCRRLALDLDVLVVCPHARGAARREELDGVAVHRFRYADDRRETLVNDGGILTNLRRSRWKWALVLPFLAAEAAAARRAIRHWRPDVVHAHWLVPQGAVAALLCPPRRLPFAVTSHGADLFSLGAGPLPALKRWVVRRAGAVTVVSEAMRTELGRLGVTPDRVAVQPMGVDLRERFRPDPDRPRSPGEILFVGRLVEKKGVRHLLRAMPAVAAAWPEASLTVAGFGPEEPALRRLAEELGLGARVRFLGGVPQSALPDLYRRAAVVAAPFVRAASGDVEGFGLVVAEAIGCGAPVVVGDVPAVRDVLGPRSGLPVVDAADPERLAAAILSVLADPAGAAARAAAVRRRLLGEIDWDAVAAAYAGLLRRLAGATARPSA